MNQVKFLPPVKFQLHADDHEKYGADWYVYDEEAILRLPVGELRDIEHTIEMSLPEMMNRSRLMYADATLAQMWVARRMAGIKESFADFTPIVFLADWEIVPAKGADADPPDSGSSKPSAAQKRSSGGSSPSSRSSRTSRRKP